MGSKKRGYYCYYDTEMLRAVIILLGFLCFFINLNVGWSQDHDQDSSKFAEAVVQKMKGGEVVKIGPNLDINKRRVPNGPDPIHNRRAGNSGRPPGQA